MIKELSSVVLTNDLPALGLKAGDVETVVLVHGAKGYEVEFMTLDGHTFAVTSLTTDQVRAVGKNELTHARPVAAAS